MYTECNRHNLPIPSTDTAINLSADSLWSHTLPNDCTMGLIISLIYVADYATENISAAPAVGKRRTNGSSLLIRGLWSSQQMWIARLPPHGVKQWPWWGDAIIVGVSASSIADRPRNKQTTQHGLKLMIFWETGFCERFFCMTGLHLKHNFITHRY